MQSHTHVSQQVALCSHPIEAEVVVPVQAIVAFDLSLHKVDTSSSRCSHRIQSGRVEKWQLSSDDHANVLRLLSCTLDEQVADAVANVSGRS